MHGHMNVKFKNIGCNHNTFKNVFTKTRQKLRRMCRLSEFQITSSDIGVKKHINLRFKVKNDISLLSLNVI
jgi:hypothetical protein